MKKKILIADDEACVVKILKDRFTHWGYLVETASDGEETLEKVESFNPHLIILDIRMPKIDGLEVLERTKSKYPQISILILTASPSRKTFKTCSEMEAAGYILKPFNPESLRERVETILKTTIS